VIEPEQVEDGGVEIAKVDLAFDALGTGLAGAAMGEAGFDPAAGQPEGEGAGVVAGLIFAIARGETGAAELAAPDDEGVLKQTALVEVVEQGGDGRIGGGAVGVEVAAVVGVLVPAAVIEFDEAHAGLAEAAGEQALAAEVGGFAGARSVAFPDLVALEGGGGFLAEIEQAWCDGLHAEAEFQGLNDAFELAVLRVAAPVVAIHFLNEIELAAFDGLGEVAAGDVGQGGAGHVLAVDADGGAGVDGEGRPELAYSAGLEVLRLMKPGRFWFSVPRP
jgi:hypothetical protein